MKKSEFTKAEDRVIRALAEKCAGVAPGEKRGRWTHEDRVAIVYAVICGLIRNNKKNENLDTKN